VCTLVPYLSFSSSVCVISSKVLTELRLESMGALMTYKVLIRCTNKLNNYKVQLKEAKNAQPFERVSYICFVCKGRVTE